MSRSRIRTIPICFWILGVAINVVAAHRAAAVAEGHDGAAFQAALESVVAGRQGALGQRFLEVEADLAGIFDALPKKSAAGRLSLAAVRHVVHSYFGFNHGWLLEGLESHAFRVSSTKGLEDLRLLKERGSSMLKALSSMPHLSERGLTLKEVVAYIVGLEQLVYHESMELLETSYEYAGQSMDKSISNKGLFQTLRAFTAMFIRGGKYLNVTHYKNKTTGTKAMESTTTFLKGAIEGYHFERAGRRNGFKKNGGYNFRKVWELTQTIIAGYSRYQDQDCRSMKAELLAMGAGNTGRVRLSEFYKERAVAEYAFTETVSYLSAIGALDDSDERNPKVIIANYVNGPSNCVAPFRQFSVCCINECLGIMRDVESQVKSPAPSLAELLPVLSKLRSTSVLAGRELTTSLKDKIEAIAEQSGGVVPLHGRLFAQWLHWAFPNECPYPSKIDPDTSLMPVEYQRPNVVSRSERYRISNQPSQAEHWSNLQEPPNSHWSMDEVLPLSPEEGPGGWRLCAFDEIAEVLIVVLFFAFAPGALRRFLPRFKFSFGSRWADKKVMIDSDEEEDLVTRAKREAQSAAKLIAASRKGQPAEGKGKKNQGAKGKTGEKSKNSKAAPKTAKESKEPVKQSTAAKVSKPQRQTTTTKVVDEAAFEQPENEKETTGEIEEIAEDVAKEEEEAPQAAASASTELEPEAEEAEDDDDDEEEEAQSSEDEELPLPGAQDEAEEREADVTYRRPPGLPEPESHAPQASLAAARGLPEAPTRAPPAVPDEAAPLVDAEHPPTWNPTVHADEFVPGAARWGKQKAMPDVPPPPPPGLEHPSKAWRPQTGVRDHVMRSVLGLRPAPVVQPPEEAKRKQLELLRCKMTAKRVLREQKAADLAKRTAELQDVLKTVTCLQEDIKQLEQSLDEDAKELVKYL
eukprot:TRINITY_DN33104_c0_g1_i1.p1 TRINITY_DN33104_c0_g1~~TRINITY_DN33104_c0_g1_i1.p1  ORF type:complete len:917 (+),score=249.28 TRINITY_DN33104_c0_g1_i1:140-2890(+)